MLNDFVDELSKLREGYELLEVVYGYRGWLPPEIAQELVDFFERTEESER